MNSDKGEEKLSQGKIIQNQERINKLKIINYNEKKGNV